MGSVLVRLAACVQALLLALPPAVLAAPSGEVVVEGHADFHRDGNTTTIDTATEQTIVEYESFDILPDEAVVINQPTDASRILNHIPHGDPTRLDGSLSSNGFVYVVNPAGVFAGRNAIIDVGGLVAAGGKLDHDDFRAGEDRFTDLTGDVHVAEGATITARDAVALVGRRVENYGTIVSEAGMVAFVAGENAVLGSLDGHLIVRVDGGASLPAEEGFALTQGGEVSSGGGGVVLSAGDTYSLAMNHTGVTRGREVRLEAGGEGLVQVSGEIDASDRAAGGTGGRVQVLGDRVAILDARIDASGDAGGGEILVGGDAHGAGPLPTARRTYVGSGSELSADAIARGDGGKIVVWADERTGFYGSASARGGAQGGDGGFIEVSGREYLDTGGHDIELSAPNGRSGTLLYDPNEIVIVGGSDDGSDLDGDPGDEQALDNGTLGQILGGEIGEGGAGVDEAFVIYESEIEGTDANIILEALREIRTEGSFDADDVVIMDGNSLVVRVTEGDPDAAPGTYAIDLGPDLTWRVTGGVIYVATEVGDAANPADGPRGHIRVGRLVWRPGVDETDGLEHPALLSVDPDALGVTPLGAVNLGTVVGSIEVVGVEEGGDRVGIDASGFDAADGRVAYYPLDDPNVAGDFGSSAGNVLVIAESGEIDVEGDVLAVGGSHGGTDAPSTGGDGGVVQIVTNDGQVRVLGDIDTSGGDGQAGFADLVNEEEEEGQLAIAGDGGVAGGIFLSATALQEGTSGLLVVQGDLTANGGNGSGFIVNDSQTRAASGGRGGSIQAFAEDGLIVQGSAIEASGGSGPGGGGNALPDDLSREPDNSPAVSLSIVSEDDEAPNAGIQLTDATITANGGDALAGGRGGSGGRGGNVLMDADSGALVAVNTAIQANGGDGVGGPSGDDLLIGGGGEARAVRLIGDAGVFLEDGSTIAAVGGASVNGTEPSRGRDSGGGSVFIDAPEGDIVVGDIDVSGGDATREDAASGDVQGGPGGSIALTTGGGTIGELEVPAGGEIRLLGRLTSFGGTGEDEDGGATRAAGGSISLDADAGIVADPGALPEIRGGAIGLTAPSIGSSDDPIRIGGTAADEDSAVLATDGSFEPAPTIEVALLASGGGDEGGLERLEVRHDTQFAETRVTDETDDPMDPPMLLVTAADEDAGTLQSVASMRSDDGDPSLHFRLDTVPGTRSSGGAELQIDRGAGMLGSAGGSITNDDGAIVAGSAGVGPHLTVGGEPDPDVQTVLALDGISIGTNEADDDTSPIEVEADPDTVLSLSAAGDVYVDVGGGVGGIDFSLADPTAAALVDLLASGDALSVAPLSDDPGDPEPGVTLSGSTQDGGADVAFELLVPVAAGGSAARVDVDGLALGGNGRIGATGDVRLVDAGGPSVTYRAGHALVLEAGAGQPDGSASSGSIVWSDPASGAAIQVDGDADAAELVLLANGGSVGDVDGDALVTRVTGALGEGLELAAVAAGDLRLRNEDGAELVLTQVDLRDPTDLSGGTSTRTVRGVQAVGVGAEVEIDNQDRAIVLGELLLATPTSVARHVQAGGDVSLLSDVRIENAQFVPALELGAGGAEEGELVAANTAGVFADGDVRFAGAIDAGDVTASDPEGAVDDADVFPTLVVAATGSASYEADVGGSGALATLDTSHAIAAGEGETRSFDVGEAIFRGGLDGPAGVEITGVADALSGDDPTTRVSFGGDVGAGSAVGGLSVAADRIAFAVDGGGSAEEVIAGAGGILLDTGATDVPQVATISDAAGNLRIRTDGSFAVGELDKLSAVGALSITADAVRVGDLSASRIEVNAPTIEVANGRGPGPVERPDGSVEPDGGTDWVANDIALGSAPVLDDPDASLRFFLGSGGIRVPGGLDAYEVRRIDAAHSAVGSASFFGRDGVVLDLTGDGPPLVADASSDTPRPAPSPLPEVPPRPGSGPPSPGVPVGAAEVLAFLRCVELDAAPAGACTPQDAATLAGVRRLRDTALSTPRAREITERYRELVAAPGAIERLRAAFAEAGAAFAATREWRDGTLDGAELYRFLASAPRAHREALAAVNELAWLHTELALLGLADEDTRRLQRTLAGDFAQAAGLSADAVLAAVDASPIGLPGPQE